MNAYCNMDEPWKHNSKQKKPDKIGYRYMIPFRCIVQNRKIYRSRKQIYGCQRDWEGGNRE